MAELLIAAWLVPCVPLARMAGRALRRRWSTASGAQKPVRVPRQRTRA